MVSSSSEFQDQKGKEQLQPNAQTDRQITSPASPRFDQAQATTVQPATQQITGGQQNEFFYEGLLTLFNGLLVLVSLAQVITMILQKRIMDGQKATMDRQQEAMDAQNEIMTTQSAIMTEQKNTAKLQAEISQQQNNIAARQSEIMESQSAIMDGQLKATQTSADAAKESVIAARDTLNLAQLRERAYVDLSHHPPGLVLDAFTGSNSDDPIDRRRIRLTIGAKNHGQTIGTVTARLVHLLFSNEPLPAVPPYEEASVEVFVCRS